MVVTATGMQTQMGQIATMLTSVTRTRSPLQKELDSLTKVLGIIAWGAVARDHRRRAGPRHPGRGRCSCWARRWRSRPSRPACRPSCRAAVATGAKQLAEAKAVVKNLTDVETLGATSAINTDKTGTLTLNQMMVSTLYATGPGSRSTARATRKTGAITSVAGAPVPDFTRLALGLALDSDATVVATTARSSATRPRPPWWCWPPSSGIDAEETRRAYPRLAEVPFDSDYKFMATFHRIDGRRRRARRRAGQGRARTSCSPAAAWRAGRSAARRSRSSEAARRHRGGQRADGREGPAGPRVRRRASLDDAEQPRCDRDPMSLTHDLAFAGMVGIIDPLRAEAKDAVRDRARGRHRRPDDHRRPRGHRAGDRETARPRTGCHQRRRAAGARPTTSCGGGCPSCTCSVG